MRGASESPAYSIAMLVYRSVSPTNPPFWFGGNLFRKSFLRLHPGLPNWSSGWSPAKKGWYLGGFRPGVYRVFFLGWRSVGVHPGNFSHRYPPPKKIWFGRCIPLSKKLLILVSISDFRGVIHLLKRLKQKAGQKDKQLLAIFF